MLKFSQLISLPLINLYDMKIEGYIENILINPEQKKIENFIIYNEKEDVYYIVKYCDIYKIGKDCVYISNSSKITLYENLEMNTQSYINPINAICYDIDGTQLGKISEIYFSNSKIDSLLINDKNYPISAICGINDIVVIISQNKPINLKRFKQSSKRITTKLNKQPITTNEPIVAILNNKNISPTREITNYNFLLNRLILKDIKNHSGEVIANKNSIVTLNTIQKLKYYGKIKELMLNSKNY